MNLIAKLCHLRDIADQTGKLQKCEKLHTIGRATQRQLADIIWRSFSNDGWQNSDGKEGINSKKFSSCKYFTKTHPDIFCKIWFEAYFSLKIFKIHLAEYTRALIVVNSKPQAAALTKRILIPIQGTMLTMFCTEWQLRMNIEISRKYIILINLGSEQKQLYWLKEQIILTICIHFPF